VPTIEVSEYVKKKLDEIKEREQHKSYDSVIRVLLEVYAGRRFIDRVRWFLAEESARALRRKFVEDPGFAVRVLQELGVLPSGGTRA